MGFAGVADEAVRRACSSATRRSTMKYAALQIPLYSRQKKEPGGMANTPTGPFEVGWSEVTDFPEL